MKNNYRTEKVDHLTYTEEDWKRYFDFQTKCFALNKEPMSFDSWEELKLIVFKSVKELGEYTYMVWKNGQEKGIFKFSVIFKDDLAKRYTYLRYDMDDRYFEPDLLEKIFKDFIDFDEASKYLASRSKNGTNDYVEDLYDAKIGSISELYEFNVKEANLEKIDAWFDEAAAKFPNLRIAFYDEIPDDLLDEFAALFTQLNKDMPANSFIEETKVTAASIKSRQETFKVKDYCLYYYLIFNESNQIIAQTHVSLKRHQAQKIHQNLTGVMERYRGRGLSKWLKAAMYKKLVADFPGMEKIKTETHPENHASRELSKQMGYKRISIAKEFLIARAKIVEHLDANG